jgi:sec-independent protein translocase protein TatA
MSLDNPLHLVFLLVLLLLVFGAKRLPEMGRSLGSGMRGFRDALTGDTHSDAAQTDEPTRPSPAALQAAAPNSVLETGTRQADRTVTGA